MSETSSDYYRNYYRLRGSAGDSLQADWTTTRAPHNPPTLGPMSTLDSLPIDPATVPGLPAGIDPEVARRTAAAIAWRLFRHHYADPIPGVPRLPFGLRQPRVGQLRALIERMFGPEPGTV